jgi:hypothetical protein
VNLYRAFVYSFPKIWSPRNQTLFYILFNSGKIGAPVLVEELDFIIH